VRTRGTLGANKLNTTQMVVHTMRNRHFVLAIAAVLASCLVSTVHALENCPKTRENCQCRKPCYSDQNYLLPQDLRCPLNMYGPGKC
jgi:hypothetical protein